MSEKNDDSLEDLSVQDDSLDLSDQPIITSVIVGRSGKEGAKTLRFEWKQNGLYSAGKVLKLKLCDLRLFEH